MTLNPSDQDLDIARELTQDRLPNRRMKRIASALAIERDAALAKGREEALAKGREEALEETAKLCADWAPEVHRLPATVPLDYAAGWEDACRNCEREIRALSPSSPVEPPVIYQE